MRRARAPTPRMTRSSGDCARVRTQPPSASLPPTAGSLTASGQPAPRSRALTRSERVSTAIRKCLSSASAALATMEAMAEDTGNRGTQRRNRSGLGRPNTPGWRVTPAPDGRGGGTPGTPAPRTNGRWIVALIVLGLLLLNFWISSQALQTNKRVRIPYFPTFINAVNAGNVSEVTTTGSSVQGRFKTAVKYPASDPNAQATTRFATEIPSFADENKLDALLNRKKVVQNAE